MISSNEEILLALSILDEDWITQAQAIRLGRAIGLVEATVRSSLFRLSRSGTLERSSEGFRLSRAARTRYDLTLPQEAWNDRFLGVAFSAEEVRRKRRDGLRYQLRRLGFAPLSAGMMVRPDWPEGHLLPRLQVLSEDETWSLTRLEVLQEPAPRFAARIFPMNEWDREARLLAERWERLGPAIHELSERESLAFRVELESQWLEWQVAAPLFPKELCLRHPNLWRAVSALTNLRERCRPGLQAYAALLLSRKR